MAVPSPDPKSTNSRRRPTCLARPAFAASLDEMYRRARATFARGVAMNGSGERICERTKGAVIPTTQTKDPPIAIAATRRRVEPASSAPSAVMVQSRLYVLLFDVQPIRPRGGGSCGSVGHYCSIWSPISPWSDNIVRCAAKDEKMGLGLALKEHTSVLWRRGRVPGVCQGVCQGP